MAFGDFTRIKTNLQSLRALTSLQHTNQQLGLRQMRLATGSRLNRAEDDAAGYSIANKLQARIRGQAQALANVGDAKNMLTVAEDSLGSVMDILQTMKEKTIQAANDTVGSEERAVIKSELNALSAEVGELIADAEYNGQALLGEVSGGTTSSVSLTFQVNAESGDTFQVTINSTTVEGLGIASSNLVVASAASAGATLDYIDTAIQTLANRLGDIGNYQKRLSFKQDALTTSMNGYEAARSRIADADFAREQMEIVKLQILQQTGTAALAQANVGPQSILSLF